MSDANFQKIGLKYEKCIFNFIHIGTYALYLSRCKRKMQSLFYSKYTLKNPYLVHKVFNTINNNNILLSIKNLLLTLENSFLSLIILCDEKKGGGDIWKIRLEKCM